MWVRGFIVGVIIVSSILQLVTTKPFLHNALIALASSASASASSSSAVIPTSAKLTNIADLTGQVKAKQLEKEKQVIDDDDFQDDPCEDENNEASPSIIQKKINKILTKLRLIASLSGPASTTSTITSEEETNSTASTTQVSTSEVNLEFEEFTTHKPGTIQKLIYTSKESEEPLRINLLVNDVEDVKETEENIEDINDVQKMSRIGQIGIFFVELFGSLVGLAYGAVAHINKVMQGESVPETSI